MHNDVKEILLNEEEIAEIVSRIAKEISEDYKGKKLLLVCVLKGSICFTADLMRKITVPLHIEFLRAKSYLAGSAESCGDVQVRSAIENLSEYDVVVVEDIFDTGNSLDFTYKHLLSKEPASLKICTLLDKPEGRGPGITLVPDYVGFTIPNEFVVGYGLDFNEHYRNLPYVGVLKPEAYQ